MKICKLKIAKLKAEKVLYQVWKNYQLDNFSS